jgi:methionyl-tRNA formyltransferase
MTSPRIVFFGTPEFACTILQALIDEKYHIAAVVSQPDKPVGRKHIIVKTPVHALAEENGIPVLQPEKLRAEADAVLAYEPELIVTCAYGQFVPSKILNAPKYGALNVHPSLLPKYRGGAPIQRAIMNGDQKTGVCLMEMIKAMDAGRVYARTETEIGPDETGTELFERLEGISAKLLRDNLPLYLEGKLEGVPQNDEEAVLAPNIAREEELVRFADSDLSTLYNHIRGLIEEPCAYGMVNGKRFKFCRVRKQNCDPAEAPGTIAGFENHAMKIAAKGGYLLVEEMQPEGRSRMNADAFANGAGRGLINAVFE